MNLRIKKYSKKLGLVVILFQLISLGCGNDNPMAPEKEHNITIYLPLKEDYTARYKFTCGYWAGHGQGYSIRLVKGNLTMNVPDIISHQSLLFAKLLTTFSVLSDSSWDARGPGMETIINASGPYNIVNEYDLIQSADSVWNVSDALDFNRLDEGNRSLLMHRPGNDYCQLDLSFIVLNGWDAGSKLYKAEFKADTLVYTVNDDLLITGGGLYKRGAVKFLKYRGLESIECNYGNGWGTLSSQTWEVKYTRQ